MTATTTVAAAVLRAQIAALDVQLAEARAAKEAAERAVRAEEKEDRKLFREFDKAMKVEFLASDRAAEKAVRARAREDILAILKEQDIKPRELARLLKAEVA